MDGMDSDKDLFLTENTFSQENLLPHFSIGFIFGEIIHKDDGTKFMRRKS